VRARNYLEQIARSEPELAIVEDDLRSWNEDRANAEIARLNAENESVKRDLELAFEKAGGLKQTIEALENSRASSRKRFQLGGVASRIHQSAEDWMALSLAERAVDRISRRLEETSVSGTLSVASRLLDRMTQGRFRRIWAPLGGHHLRVDDEYGRHHRVEELSGGTREQMFLAIRMALVQEFAERGADLPMVMDDVFVNFDQVRTEAAVETLLEFADRGHQILFFTCHLHLARLFHDRGITTVRLPGPRPSSDYSASESARTPEPVAGRRAG